MPYYLKEGILDCNQVKSLFIKIITLYPLPFNCMILLARSIKFKWNKPYLGFWEQNKKTYFMINLVYYHVGIRVFK